MYYVMDLIPSANEDINQNIADKIKIANKLINKIHLIENKTSE